MDGFIEQLVELLEEGDIIIDGGNSEHQDTTRRCAALKEKGILYVGSGVSGGEEGARYGPSLMPGGHIEAWPAIKPIFQVRSAAQSIIRPKSRDWGRLHSSREIRGPPEINGIFVTSFISSGG